MKRAVVVMCVCVCALIGSAVPVAEADVSATRSVKDASMYWSGNRETGGSDVNYGALGVFWVGARGAEGMRGLLQFDLPFGAIGAGNVNSAALSLWVQQGDGGMDANIYRLTHDWVEGNRQYIPGTGYINPGSGATYNSYKRLST